ncbi:hypothetical protein NF27_CG01190 [Candidatus Jidaibacter acanthamoeba]|uniref:Uncharacterized protein n=1 Tax=Candidatus Jidaibacter acanthamoebae TaxID=86105 RepID=A0A0C1QK62_9RICK|nr:hypothetical protein [Candidatus Jidaibacter acanthamoeba]KIE05939.1 hypothetical protein NF27_CG01190 [Candidatus Jidaibacter acanthamoeba]
MRDISILHKKRKGGDDEREKLNDERTDRIGRPANHTKNEEGHVAQIKRSRTDKGKQKDDGRSLG